jgi:hypothetical protein
MMKDVQEELARCYLDLAMMQEMMGVGGWQIQKYY